MGDMLQRDGRLRDGRMVLGGLDQLCPARESRSGGQRKSSRLSQGLKISPTNLNMTSKRKLECVRRFCHGHGSSNFQTFKLSFKFDIINTLPIPPIANLKTRTVQRAYGGSSFKLQNVLDVQEERVRVFN